MKKYNNHVSVEVRYVNIDRTVNRLQWSDDDVAVSDHFHTQGFNAYIEGNILVLSKPYPWGSECRLEWVIIPGYDGLTYHTGDTSDRYGRAMEIAERIALMHTMQIVRRVNTGR